MLFDEVMEEPDQNRTVLNMIKKNFLPVLGPFFHGSGSGFFADPDPHSGKRVRSGSGQKDPDQIQKH